MSGYKYLSQEEAIQLDKDLMGSEMGFINEILMELAGLSCAQSISEIYPVTSHPNILVVVGPGNNGGDGMVCARHLHHFGYNVSCCYPKRRDIAPWQGLLKQCLTLGITFYSNLTEFSFKDFNVLVDAIFGYSFAGDIRAPFDAILPAIKDSLVPIASIDIPSGWNVETGDPSGEGLQPEFLISLGAPKQGVKDFKGKHHFLGGRFVPKPMLERYQLNLPPYPGSQQYVRLN